jgi:hypothetical protein
MFANSNLNLISVPNPQYMLVLNSLAAMPVVPVKEKCQRCHREEQAAHGLCDFCISEID